MWLGQNDLATALQITVETLLVTETDVLLLLYEDTCSVESVVVTLFLIAFSQIDVQARILLAHFANGRIDFFFKARLAPVGVIKSARDLTDEEVKEGIRRIVGDYVIGGTGL